MTIVVVLVRVGQGFETHLLVRNENFVITRVAVLRGSVVPIMVR